MKQLSATRCFEMSQQGYSCLRKIKGQAQTKVPNHEILGTQHLKVIEKKSVFPVPLRQKLGACRKSVLSMSTAQCLVHVSFTSYLDNEDPALSSEKCSFAYHQEEIPHLELHVSTKSFCHVHNVRLVKYILHTWLKG